jgi:hypothetical protein
MRKEEECVLQRAERAMVRMMCGVKLRDRKISSELMSMVGLSEDIVILVRKSRLRWYGHVMRRDEGVGIRRVLEFEVAGEIGRGRPPMGWLRRDDAQVRVAWRRGVSGFSSSADER